MTPNVDAFSKYKKKNSVGIEVEIQLVNTSCIGTTFRQGYPGMKRCPGSIALRVLIRDAEGAFASARYNE